MKAKVPSAESCVLRYLLERRALEIPDNAFIVVDRDQDGCEVWTYRDTLERTRNLAARLATIGVRPGDRVPCFLSNAKHALEVWFAVNYIGGVYVPINAYYRGSILERVILQSSARLIVTETAFLPRLAEVSLGALEVAAITDRDEAALTGIKICALSDIRPMGAIADPCLQPWDTQSVIFTSGTTGPSKGVLSSYCHLFSVVEEPYDFLTTTDRYLCNLPLFHVGGMLPVYAMLVRGGSVAISAPFKTHTFWDAIRRTESTACTLLSGMSTLLTKQPASCLDQDHTLRKALVIPLHQTSSVLADRFGVEVWTIYHMTEICAPLFSGPNPQTPASCGRPRLGTSVRLVDQHDREVERGQVGELIVRTDRPWAMSHGYLDNPSATASAWMNGWFHTGDAFRVNTAGEYIFVDRIKDVIRRRGENISSFEVEREICRHPAVRDAAAIAVPDENGEDEVLVVIEPKPGEKLDPEQLLAFVEPLLPRFMLPRYLQCLDELPRTPTGKVQKAELRCLVSVRDAWDGAGTPRASDGASRS